jgi:hypothetical protein
MPPLKSTSSWRYALLLSYFNLYNYLKMSFLLIFYTYASHPTKQITILATVGPIHHKTSSNFRKWRSNPPQAKVTVD